jgi:hypothetical protein
MEVQSLGLNCAHSHACEWGRHLGDSTLPSVRIEADSGLSQVMLGTGILPNGKSADIKLSALRLDY